MSSRKLVLITLLFALFCGQELAVAATQAPTLPKEKYAIDYPLEGKTSPYTAYVLQLIKNWPPKSIPLRADDPAPVKLRCLATPGDDTYIGMEQWMMVKAPFAEVEKVLDDINHYKELFPDYDDVHIVSTDGNKLTTFWEQHVPVFFIPNVKYEMLYLISKPKAGLKFYRYLLKDSKVLSASDGVVVIEKVDENTTRYAEYDFFNADWGILKSAGPDKIWKDSAEGIFLSDAATKIKAEHPSMSNSDAKEAAKKRLDHFPIDGCVKSKIKVQAQ